MRLSFGGHRTNPAPREAGPHIVHPTYGDTDGAFDHGGSYYVDTGTDTLTVSFNPVIRIVTGLDPATRQRVLTHEQEHLRDFREKANRMQHSLQRALQQGRPHQIDARWEWFNYDLRTAANDYHRRVGQGDIRPVLEPNTPRPI